MPNYKYSYWNNSNIFININTSLWKTSFQYTACEIRENENVSFDTCSFIARLQVIVLVVVVSVVVAILFPTEYKQWMIEYMSNIITTMKP